MVELDKPIGSEPTSTETIESRTSMHAPPTLRDLVPNYHPARFVAEFVDALERADCTELGIKLAVKVLGASAYHPRVMLCFWLHGFMTGIRSS